MAIYDSASIRDDRYLFSQTPPDFVKENYYVQMTQLKVDHDWPFRPNRKNIEEEIVAGSEEYTPLEVVIDHVKSDTGTPVSDDWYRLIFRDCQRRNKIGMRYRFDYEYNPDGADGSKNVWIGLNQTSLSLTSSQVICRCNNMLGSIYTNERGENEIHYEPVVCADAINGPGFHYSMIALEQKGDLTIIAQYNKYTAQYKVNQRFIVGPDSVFKITNIVKNSSRTTSDPYDIGVIRIHLEVDQLGDKDDLGTRIAYNGVVEEPKPDVEIGDYKLIIASPEVIPEVIPDEGITLMPGVTKDDQPIATGAITHTVELVGDRAALYTVADFCEIEDHPDGSLTITRKKVAMDLSVRVTFSGNIPDYGVVELPVEFCLRPF